MRLLLLDDSLQVEVAYDPHEREYEDTVRLIFVEHCPKDERIFTADEARIFLTPDQAEQLARGLQQAATASRQAETE